MAAASPDRIRSALEQAGVQADAAALAEAAMSSAFLRTAYVSGVQPGPSACST